VSGRERAAVVYVESERKPKKKPTLCSLSSLRALFCLSLSVMAAYSEQPGRCSVFSAPP